MTEFRPITRRRAVQLGAGLVASPALLRGAMAQAADTIRIGYVNARTGPLAGFTP